MSIENAAKMFAVDCGQHEMTVRHEDGLYRHLAFRRPDTGLYWFDLVTWPGFLTIAGDMGSYTFARTADMLDFFLAGPGINPGYWAEKVQGNEDVRAYSEELMREHVEQAYSEYAEEHGPLIPTTIKLWEEIDRDVLPELYDEALARQAVQDFEFMHPEKRNRTEFVFADAWEWQVRDYRHRYLYLCHAIRWGAEQYQAARAVSV